MTFLSKLPNLPLPLRFSKPRYMKKMLLILAAVVSIAACKSNDKKNDKKNAGDTLTPEQKEKALSDSTNYTTLRWIDSTTKNLGELVKDQVIEISYRFRNTGDKNLIIESVTAQCGCTIPEKPEKPIPPGQEGVIKAKYNGSGHGAISKQIYVKANTRPDTDHTLTFTGTFNEK